MTERQLYVSIPARYCRSICRISLLDVLIMRVLPVGAMEMCRGSMSLAKSRGTWC